MATENKEAIDVLCELTLFVNDGREGYERAASEDKHESHKAFYHTLSQQRARFSEELNQFIRNLGGEPEDGTTFKGKLYRQFMDAKAALTGWSDKAIINSNLYGEEWAQKAYKEALDSNSLPENIRQVVKRQQKASADAMSRLQEMKNS